MIGARSILLQHALIIQPLFYFDFKYFPLDLSQKHARGFCWQGRQTCAEAKEFRERVPSSNIVGLIFRSPQLAVLEVPPLLTSGAHGGGFRTSFVHILHMRSAMRLRYNTLK